MTNKEAVKILHVAIAEVQWEYPMDYTQAFEKAIDALENADKSYLKGYADGLKAGQNYESI